MAGHRRRQPVGGSKVKRWHHLGPAVHVHRQIGQHRAGRGGCRTVDDLEEQAELALADAQIQGTQSQDLLDGWERNQILR